MSNNIEEHHVEEALLCKVAKSLSRSTETALLPGSIHLQAAFSGVCDRNALRYLADSSIHRTTLEDLANSELRFFPDGSSVFAHHVEAAARSVLVQLLSAYDSARDHVLEHSSCWGAHGFALMLAVLRVHAILLIVGLLQDLVSCIVYLLSRTLSRILQPFGEVIGGIAGFLGIWWPHSFQQEEPPSEVSHIWASQSAPLCSSVRQRTREALEALANSVEAQQWALRRKSSLRRRMSSEWRAMTRIGLEPQDMRRHAAELEHIQERCVPMRDTRSGQDWWLAGDGVIAEIAETEASVLVAWPRRLRLSDLLRLCGVLVPLPASILLAERISGSHEIAQMIGFCGLCCTAFAGLLERRPQRWHPALLRLLALSCCALGLACALFECNFVVLSAALLASVHFISTNGKSAGRRALPSSSFSVGHLVGSAVSTFGHPSLTSLSTMLLSIQTGKLDIDFFRSQFIPRDELPEERSARLRTTLGLLVGAVSILLLRVLRKASILPRTTLMCLIVSLGFLSLAAALLVLMPNGVLGLPFALWWLSACEVAGAATCVPKQLQPEQHMEDISFKGELTFEGSEECAIKGGA
eukprot:TRINITY_DN15391_c1_g2_i1.p1 TRINITY_DN15391_c1_g2~~TRINITY_DN15391_c1_g2_i1.p1  ORF type:complete len:611 (-),score=84.30 TRINITY_DN15391_c1_g2_i1:156-1904(-)